MPTVRQLQLCLMVSSSTVSSTINGTSNINFVHNIDIINESLVYRQMFQKEINRIQMLQHYLCPTPHIISVTIVTNISS